MNYINIISTHTHTHTHMQACMHVRVHTSSSVSFWAQMLPNVRFFLGILTLHQTISAIKIAWFNAKFLSVDFGDSVRWYAVSVPLHTIL